MMIQRRAVFGLSLLLLCSRTIHSAELEIAELATDREVLFGRDIAPILKQNCVACHNDSEEEGGVNLENVDKIRASGMDDILVNEKPRESRLFLVAAHIEEPVMPPEANDVSASPLKPNELALLQRWIANGCPIEGSTSQPKDVSFQPLPKTIQTNYTAATTPEGRLSVVSFGNQLQVFGTASTEPLASLTRGDKPAHDDLVQDVWINPSGRQIISSGFRNVKFWELDSFEPATIPEIDFDSTLAIAMNSSGDHFAVLSPPAELSVGKVGLKRWSWNKSFDLPADSQTATGAKPVLALNHSGDRVAIGSGAVVRVVVSDQKQVDELKLENALSALRWTQDQRLITGDVTGNVSIWTRDANNQWTNRNFPISEAAVQNFCVGQENTQKWIVLDSEGAVSDFDIKTSEFKKLGQLPTPAVHASAFPDGTGLWLTTPDGSLGKFDLGETKWSEISKTNPATNQRYETLRWDALVGERLIEANEKDVSRAETDFTAEEKNLEAIIKTIQSKVKDRDAKKKAAEEAKKAAENAEVKLASAKDAEKQAAASRERLESTLKELDEKLAEQNLVEQGEQIADLQKAKSETAAELEKIPDAEKLKEATKTAEELSAKAAKEAKSKHEALNTAVETLKLAEGTQTRGQARLKGLAADVERWKKIVETSKEQQTERKKLEADAKAAAEKSAAAGRGLAVVSDGSRLLVGSESPAQWNLWSGSGDWLANIPELSRGSVLAASGNAGVLFKATDGTISAMQVRPSFWHQSHELGSAAGESPFVDRVLCLDVDPAGGLMATGGGFPSRSGELMIWELPNRRLVRRVEDSHTDTVTSLSFSPDGKILATGGADRMIKLWDTETWELIRPLEGHTHHVTAIDWNVNGRQLASGSADATVKVWDIDTGKASRTISDLTSEVTKLVYFGRDNRIGITCGDGYFRVYRTDNGGRETNAKLPSGYLYALDSNDEGTRFVAGGDKGTAVVIDKSGKQVAEYSGN